MSTDGGASSGGSVKRIFYVFLFNLALSLILLQSVFLSIFTPLPQMYCHLRLGRWAGYSIPLFVLLFAFFWGHWAGFSYLIQFGISGILISEAIIRGYSIEKGFVLVISTTMVIALTVLGFAAWSEGVGTGEVVGRFAERIIDESIAINEKAGLSLQQVEEFKKIASVVVDAVKNIYPSLMIIGIMLTVWLNVMVLARLMRSAGKSPPFGELSRWKAPENLVWTAIIGGVALLSGIDGLKVIGINILLVLFIVFFFQGMAIISYHFKKREVPELLKGIGYLFVVWYMSVVVAVIGLFDLWVDFRKLSAPEGRNM